MTDREAFEKWYKTVEGEDDYIYDWDEEYKHYLRDYTQLSWTGWQAATLAERERCIKLLPEFKDFIDVTSSV